MASTGIIAVSVLTWQVLQKMIVRRKITNNQCPYTVLKAVSYVMYDF